MNSRAAQELERLKHLLSRDASSEELLRKEFAEALRGLKAAMSSIQVVKDEIQLIVSALPGSLAPEDARMRLESARQSLFASYERHWPSLDSDEKKTFHEAKNLVVGIGTLGPNDLQSIRTALSEHQSRLRDALTDRLLKKLGLVPEVVERAGPITTVHHPIMLCDVTQDSLPRSVLVIEDNPRVLEGIVGFLRRGLIIADVDGAATTRTATSMLARKDYDLILLDLHLPSDAAKKEPEGLRFFKMLRSSLIPELNSRPAVAETAVVFISGYSSPEKVGLWKCRTGVFSRTSFLQKPFAAEDLRRPLHLAYCRCGEIDDAQGALDDIVNKPRAWLSSRCDPPDVE